MPIPPRRPAEDLTAEDVEAWLRGLPGRPERLAKSGVTRRLGARTGT